MTHVEKYTVDDTTCCKPMRIVGVSSSAVHDNISTVVLYVTLAMQCHECGEIRTVTSKTRANTWPLDKR
jgi:ferredoxin-like protein FixX